MCDHLIVNFEPCIGIMYQSILSVIMRSEVQHANHLIFVLPL